MRESLEALPPSRLVLDEPSEAAGEAASEAASEAVGEAAGEAAGEALSEVIARGRMQMGDAAEAGTAAAAAQQSGPKRARGGTDGGADAVEDKETTRSGGEGPSEAGAAGALPVEFVFEVSLHVATDGAEEVRVALVATTRGEASSAFWRLAEQIRNDVVRDTRKWRRKGKA